jgi:hypothetical protein
LTPSCPANRTPAAWRYRASRIPHTEFDPETFPAAKTAFEILQRNGYPLTYVGYRRFVGYKEGEIEEVLAASR